MDKLIALKCIIDSGSFSKAAEILGYTQSAVSQMINSLENEYSVKFLNRTKKGVSLTEEGKKIYPYIERTIIQYKRLEEKINEIKGLDSGVIRIGALTSITYHWLPPLIKKFKERHPNIEFILYQGDYSSIEEWIQTDKVDFGFLTPNIISNFEYQIIKEGQMKLILPPNHPLAIKDTINLKAIENENFILLEEGRYNEILNSCKSEKIRLNIKYTMHDDYSIMKMVEVGLGVSILSELITTNMPCNIVVKDINPEIKRTISVAYKTKESLPKASQTFIEEILENKDHLL